MEPHPTLKRVEDMIIMAGSAKTVLLGSREYEEAVLAIWEARCCTGDSLRTVTKLFGVPLAKSNRSTEIVVVAGP